MFSITQNFRSQIFSRYRLIGNNTPQNRGKMKVALCGAAGNCGQATALLLKLCPLINEIALYDVEQTGGIAQELNHIDTLCDVISCSGKIKDAFENAKVVAIVARAPKTARQKDVEAFKSNALVVTTLINACCQYCPKALIAIDTNPINSLVPLAAEILKKNGVYNPNHLFGITTLDVMKANTLVAMCQGLPPENVHVPVIGGGSPNTKIPLLSLTKPATEFSTEEILKITKCVQNYKEKVLETSYKLNPFLSRSSSVAQFVTSLVRGLKGEKSVVECAFVPFDDYPNIGFFGTPIELGINGLQKNFGLPKLSDYEYCLFLNSLEYLKKDITMGMKYVTPLKVHHC